MKDRVVGSFEFGVGGSVGEKAEGGCREVIEAFVEGEPFAAFAFGQHIADAELLDASSQEPDHPR